MQESECLLDKAGKKASLNINIAKTKTLLFDKKDIEKQIITRDEEIENVAELVYLGSLITSENDCTRDIKRRFDKAKGVLAGVNTIWKCKTIGLRYQTKLKKRKTRIFSTALYAYETWTMNKTDTRKLLTFNILL